MRQKTYIGIDLGGTSIKYGLVTKGSRLLFRSERPTPASRDSIIRELASIIDDTKQTIAGKQTTLIAVGVGSAGIIDHRSGKAIGRSPNIPGWQGTEIKREIEKATGFPTLVDNDANVMALAEHNLGAGVGCSSGIYITVGTGIGSGIILNNRLWRGAHSAGAEMGHMIITKGGRRCCCGKQGCLEVYTNAASFRRYYGKPLPPGKGAKYIFQLARSGDHAARNAILKAADWLAAGIGSVLELINPEIVVIGGGIATGTGYLRAVSSSLPSYCTVTARRRVKIRKAKLGKYAGVIGAALLAMDD